MDRWMSGDTLRDSNQIEDIRKDLGVTKDKMKENVEDGLGMCNYIFALCSNFLSSLSPTGSLYPVYTQL